MTPKSSTMLKMAVALLMDEGELSLFDIQALPLVDNEKLATAIALSIYNHFEVEWDENSLRLKGDRLIPKVNEKREVILSGEETKNILDEYILTAA